ncbi:hypothetical protein [Spiroplasma endosymbiont of Atherix ibis]|uniref:hypothetical protein n=1 Tax=Spiroplasma endosymbiont of Atherix ibis TaxID=3066291 RepID=UPI0030CBAAE3
MNEQLFNNVKNIINDDKEIKKAVNKIVKFKILFVLFLVFLISFCIFFSASLITFVILFFKEAWPIKILLNFLYAIILLFILSIIYWRIYKKIQKMSNYVNKKIAQKNVLNDVYINYYSLNKEFQDITDLKLVYENYDIKILEKNGVIYDFLKKRFENSYFQNNSLKEEKLKLNYLSFNYKGRKAKFLIKMPMEFSLTEEYNTMGIIKQLHALKKDKLTSIISRDKLFIEDLNLKKNCSGFIIAEKRGFIKGDYKSESIAFNKKYDTNCNSTDIKANRFLTVQTLDILSKLEDKNLFKLLFRKWKI